MSEPIRYNVKRGDEGYQIAESLGGEWVRYGDYARLKAENERMSDVARYTAAGEGVVRTDSAGPLVVWQDYARLKAEVERLRASSFVTAVPVEQYERLKEEVERLTGLAESCKKIIKRKRQSISEYREEIERLTKAHGDALADFWAIHKGYFDLKAENEKLRKEYRQP